MVTQEDFERFCDSFEIRPQLRKPYVRGGYKIATNGRVLLVGQTDEPDTPEDPKNPFPKQIHELLGEAQARAKSWAPWRAEDEKRREMVCTECNGSGRVLVKCATCNGEGECECDDCGAVHDCGVCKGVGKIGGADKCPHCEDGKLYITDYIITGGHIIDGDYFQRVASLPGVEFGIVKKKNVGIPFRCDGAAGVVMPRRDDIPY